MPVLTFEPQRLVLRRPLITAWGQLRERQLIRVRLTWPDGSWGEGEAAPLEPYDGVSLAAVRAALDAYAAVLAAAAPDTPPETLLAACAAERPLPQALAAVDLALWDRAGRQAGVPVARLLAPDAAGGVFVNATISAQNRAEAAAQAARAAADGYICVKVKVGVGDDAGRVAAVRAGAGPRMAIRVDANGAWADPQEALANLRSLVGAGIELAEEPVHGVEALRAVRDGSAIPVAMDETAAEPGALAAGAVDAVCLKVARCGGITGVMDQAAVARAAGAHVYVASTFDGPLGVAAGLHAAAALSASGQVAACGLATLPWFAELADVLPIDDGAMLVPSGPGLLGMDS